MNFKIDETEKTLNICQKNMKLERLDPIVFINKENKESLSLNYCEIENLDLSNFINLKKLKIFFCKINKISLSSSLEDLKINSEDKIDMWLNLPCNKEFNSCKVTKEDIEALQNDDFTTHFVYCEIELEECEYLFEEKDNLCNEIIKEAEDFKKSKKVSGHEYYEFFEKIENIKYNKEEYSTEFFLRESFSEERDLMNFTGCTVIRKVK